MLRLRRRASARRRARRQMLGVFREQSMPIEFELEMEQRVLPHVCNASIGNLNTGLNGALPILAYLCPVWMRTLPVWVISLWK
jgi:hypothetical protein